MTPPLQLKQQLMFDFKKIFFCNGITKVIKDKPGWTSDVIKAITAGIDKAVLEREYDNKEMAVLLLIFYLNDKYGTQISKKSKLKTIEKLKLYFDMKIMERPEAIELFENMSNIHREFDEKEGRL